MATDWLASHEHLVVWITIISVVTFIGTLIAIPVVVARLPTDYFMEQAPRRAEWQRRHPVVRTAVVALRNVLGLVLVLAGVLMLFTPGQGVLMILLGVMLMDFPGKYALERRIVARPGVLRALNWLRRKTGKEPLRID